MANLDNFRGDGKQSIPANVTTWTVVDTSSGDDDEVTCTKAAEADRSHFITFLIATSDNVSNVAGGAVKARLYAGGGGTLLLEAWIGQEDASGPTVINFAAPIQITENTDAIFTSAMSADDDQVTFTMGGFTNDTRIE